MESQLAYHDAKALLEWHIELGADEAILDAPINRYEIPQEAPRPAAVKPAAKSRKLAPAIPVASEEEKAEQAASEARKIAADLAANADTLDALREAIAGFEGCDLKKGARNTLFADGNADARVMVIGEVPSVDEDRNGTPFTGAAGELFDKMFAAIGLLRSSPDPQTALYATNILPWRTPQDRPPSPDELELLRVFTKRHIELATPDVIVLMGNAPCQSLLGKGNVNRQRGNWASVDGIPALPMRHPERLLRNPASKREAWEDLLSLQARLREKS